MNIAGIHPHSVRTELIWANHRAVEPDFQRMRFTVRDETACWYVSRGAVRLRGKAGDTRAGAGDWMFPGEEPSDVAFEPDSRILSIRFRFLFTGGERVYVQPDPLRIGSEAAEALLVPGRALVEAVEPCRAPGTLLLGRSRIRLPENLEIEARFHDWLAAYCRGMEGEGRMPRVGAPKDGRVARALDLLDRHPMREPFTEAGLASDCGIGARQLRRLMERETGHPPFAHYDRRRLDLARHALRDTAMPMKEIAFELGFRAPPHFSNWFRKRTGTSPRQFRRA